MTKKVQVTIGGIDGGGMNAGPFARFNATVASTTREAYRPVNLGRGMLVVTPVEIHFANAGESWSAPINRLSQPRFHKLTQLSFDVDGEGAAMIDGIMLRPRKALCELIAPTFASLPGNRYQGSYNPTKAALVIAILLLAIIGIGAEVYYATAANHHATHQAKRR